MVMCQIYPGHECRALFAIMPPMSSPEPQFNIEKKPFESEVADVMNGSSRWEIKVHDHGMVALWM